MTLNLVTAVRPPEPEPPPRSQARQGLADAISAAQEASNAVAEAREASARGRVVLAAAEAEHAAALEAVAAGREADAEALAAGIRAGGAPTSGAVRQARRRAEDAEDGVGVAKSAMAKLESDVADLEAAAGRSALAVEAAVNVVLAETAAPLIDDLERTKVSIAGRQAALNFIRNRAGVRHGNVMTEIAALAAPLAAVSERIRDAVEIGLYFHPLAAEQHPIAERWRRAVAALTSDADAPLPTADTTTGG